MKAFSKVLFPVWIALTLSGCSTMGRFLTDGGKRNPISTDKIAVISTLGDTFSVFCIGTTVFNGRNFDCNLAGQSMSSNFAMKAQSILQAGGYNATLLQNYRSQVGVKKTMMAVGGERDVVAPLLAELSKKGYTALLLISDWRSDYYDGARQVSGAIHDVGLCSSSMFNLMRQSYLHASIEVHLYDVRDPENFRVERELKTQTIKLDGEWPKSFDEIPIAKRNEYLGIIKQLINGQLDSTVKKVMLKI